LQFLPLNSAICILHSILFYEYEHILNLQRIVFALSLLNCFINQEKAELKEQLARVERSCHIDKAQKNESEASQRGWWWGGAELQIQARKDFERATQAKRARSCLTMHICHAYMKQVNS
jgi:hypothetical protein